MLAMRSIALAASIIGFTSAAPSLEVRQNSWTPGTQNNTQEFLITLKTTSPNLEKYNGWILEPWHTGAGEADPVFTSNATTPAFLNGTSLQFDVDAYPFGVNGLPFDDNYGRWEPVTVTSGYGSGPWVNSGENGLTVDAEESDGWLVCEWYHGDNAPQLFQLIKGFDGVGTDPLNVPATCGPVLLIPQWI